MPPPSARSSAPASCSARSRSAIGSRRLVGVLALAALFRWKVSNPLLIAVTAVIGLIAFPLLQPAWVTFK